MGVRRLLYLWIAAALTCLVTETDVLAELSPGPPSPPGSDWRMYRYDPALTAGSPLKGGRRGADIGPVL
jgi:hypothetical protein